MLEHKYSKISDHGENNEKKQGWISAFAKTLNPVNALRWAKVLNVYRSEGEMPALLKAKELDAHHFLSTLIHFWYPLDEAATCRDFDKLKVLVKTLGADINSYASSVETPLHIAARRGDVEFMGFLINELGADVNARDSTGYTPLHDAARNNDIKVMDVLINRFGADCFATTRWRKQTPLSVAASCGALKAVNFLLDIDDVSRRESCGRELTAKGGIVGYSVLHNAAIQGDLKMINRVLEYHDVAASAAKDCNLVLCLAHSYGHGAIVDRLLDLPNVRHYEFTKLPFVRGYVSFKKLAQDREKAIRARALENNQQAFEPPINHNTSAASLVPLFALQAGQVEQPERVDTTNDSLRWRGPNQRFSPS